MILNTFYVLSLNRGSDLNDVREKFWWIFICPNYNKKAWSLSFIYLCMILCCLQISVLRQMPNVEVLSLRYSYNIIQLEFESVDLSWSWIDWKSFLFESIGFRLNFMFSYFAVSTTLQVWRILHIVPFYSFKIKCEIGAISKYLGVPVVAGIDIKLLVKLQPV